MQAVRRTAPLVLLLGLITALAVWLWLMGGAARISIWAAGEQREVQTALAGALRSVRAGEPWGLAALWGLCFAYGFFHAAGPGHGKLIMGGYALGEDVRRRRLIGLTLAGSLGQAVTAVLLVSVGAALFGLGRQQMTGLADGALAAISAGAVALVGLWLVWRGLRRLSKAGAGPSGHAAAHAHAAQTHEHGHTQGHGQHDAHHHHNHSHAAGEVCSECGHAHGPSADQVRSATDWRSALAVVAAIAIRPCTGALFVLILTFSMGIPLAGIMGALVMGLGTAVLTLVVALGAAHVRGSLASSLSGMAAVRMMSVVEIAAGAIVAIVAVQVALRVM